jgi:PilZ domain-containing protein
MDEKRKSPRMHRLKEGRIYFNDKKSIMSCIVRDLSEGGARVTVSEPYLLPAEFELVIHGSPARPARKVWVKQNEMGIEFLA